MLRDVKSNLILFLSTRGHTAIARSLFRFHGVDSLKISRVMIFSGLVGRQDVFLLVDVSEAEVLQICQQKSWKDIKR